MRKRTSSCKTNIIFASVEARGSLNQVGHLALYRKHSINSSEVVVTDCFLFIPEEGCLSFPLKSS